MKNHPGSRDSQLNQAIKNLNVENMIEQVEDIFKDYYAVNVAIRFDDEELFGRDLICKYIMQSVAPLHIFLELGEWKLSNFETVETSERENAHHSVWRFALAVSDDSPKEIVWESSRVWQEGFVIYEKINSVNGE